jgi:hypothetical protein
VPPAKAVRGQVDFRQTYADEFAGWPLKRQDRGHQVYGTFLNPTTGWPSGMPGLNVGYHKAIDILVDDSKGPQPILAIEGGVVREATHSVQVTPLKVRVNSGVVGIGHFRYAHCVPNVAVGQRVSAGDTIGHTVPGWWHTHLEEIAEIGGKRVLLNPLRPGGKLRPPGDKGKPRVEAMRVYAKTDENNPSPRVVPLNQVRGVVVPVALALDDFGMREWPGSPKSPLHVYRASIRLTRGTTVVQERTLFRIDMAPGPTWQHFFRPLTRRSAPVAVCAVRKPKSCDGAFWIRLWEQGWDTRRVPNGRYELAVTVADTVGNEASRTIQLRVAN